MFNWHKPMYYVAIHMLLMPDFGTLKIVVLGHYAKNKWTSSKTNNVEATQASRYNKL